MWSTMLARRDVVVAFTLALLLAHIPLLTTAGIHVPTVAADPGRPVPVGAPDQELVLLEPDMPALCGAPLLDVVKAGLLQELAFLPFRQPQPHALSDTVNDPGPNRTVGVWA